MAVAESVEHQAESFVHSPHRLLIDGDWVDAASGQTFATINPTLKAMLDREIELLFKKAGLFRFVGAVMNTGFDLIFGRSLECFGKNLRLAFLRYLDARQTMVIQTSFTKRDHARTFRQFSQRRYHIFFGLLRVSGMNTDDREDIRVFFGKIDSAPAALDRRADCDNARNAGFVRAAENIVEVWREIRIIQMGVSLYQHRAN